MSGGSYDYLEDRLASDPFSYGAESELVRMIHDLSDPITGFKYPNAAEIGTQLNAFRAQLKTIERLTLKLVERHTPLIHAVEWYVGDDHSWDEVTKAWHKFIGLPEETE
jgi:hypothetical protein